MQNNKISLKNTVHVLASFLMVGGKKQDIRKILELIDKVTTNSP